MGRNPGTPPEGSKCGTALPHTYVFRVHVPGNPHDVAPLPPMGRNTLAGVSVGMAKRCHKTKIVAAVGLPTVEMLHEAPFKRKRSLLGNRTGRNRHHRRDHRDGRRSRERAQAMEKVPEEPSHDAAAEGIPQEA